MTQQQQLMRQLQQQQKRGVLISQTCLMDHQQLLQMLPEDATCTSWMVAGLRLRGPWKHPTAVSHLKTLGLPMRLPHQLAV